MRWEWSVAKAGLEGESENRKARPSDLTRRFWRAACFFVSSRLVTDQSIDFAFLAVVFGADFFGLAAAFALVDLFIRGTEFSLAGVFVLRCS